MAVNFLTMARKKNARRFPIESEPGRGMHF